MINVTLLYSTDSAYDEKFLQNYTKINVIPEIQRVPGVGQAMVFGAKDYSMRIWLKPDRLTANNISVQEVLAAIQDQNVEAAPGRFGEGSSASFEYILKYKGKLSQNKDYEDIIIKTGADGSVIKLKDIARVEFGAFSYSSNALVQGYPGTGIGIFQTAGSNANDILIAIDDVMKNAEAKFPKGNSCIHHFQCKRFSRCIHQTGRGNLAGSIYPGIPGCIYFSAGFQVNPDSRPLQFRSPLSELFFYAAIWLYHQPAYTFCIGTGHWYRSG